MTITHEEATKLGDVLEKFVENGLQVTGLDQKAAIGKIVKALPLTKKATVPAALLALKAKEASMTAVEKATAYARHADVLTEALIKAFGEDLVKKAIPEAAKNQEMADLYLKMDVKKLPSLCAH